MKKVLISVIMALFIWSVTSFNLNNSVNIILLRKNIIKLDSSPVRLYYTVYLFGILPVGEAIISDKGFAQLEGLTVYYLNAHAKANALISRFYNFSANIDSYADKNTFFPIVFKQQIKSPDKIIVKEARYDQGANVMDVAGEKRSIPPETYEPLSAVFKLMRTDWEGKNTFDLNINTNQKNYAFAGTAEKQLNGKYNVYLLKGKIFRRDKNPYHQSSVDIVLAGNKVKTPILIKVFASGVFLTVKLTRVE